MKMGRRMERRGLPRLSSRSPGLVRLWKIHRGERNSIKAPTVQGKAESEDASR